MTLILSQTIESAKRAGVVSTSSLKQVIVDTTVMEKNVSYPTDAKLYNHMRCKLVSASQKHGVKLRQNYNRVSKKYLRLVGKYAHARQMKRSFKYTRKLKTSLKSVVNDIIGRSLKMKLYKHFLPTNWNLQTGY